MDYPGKYEEGAKTPRLTGVAKTLNFFFKLERTLSRR
jgi:hypothetical protein